VESLHKARFLFLRSVRSGSLESKGLVVSIGGTTLTPGSTKTFLVGVDYTINVQDDSGRMKGALIRVSKPGATSVEGVLVPSSGAKEALACPDYVLGITHTNSTLKKSFGGTIRFPDPTFTVVLDITVVFLNKLFGGSHYAYGQYVVNFDSPL
jgi:hypothetical protein